MFTFDRDHTAAFLIAFDRTMRKESKHPTKMLPRATTIQQTRKRILCCFPFVGDIKA